MPCRYIREEYLTSERVDLLDAREERFYFRLFLVVDDFGRFEANEKLLKSKAFPLKENVRATDITHWLTACEKAGLIRLYTVSGKRYLSIERFSQTRANCRSSKSKYPDPPTEKSSFSALAYNLQANAYNLQANANNLQAFAADNESESDNENDNDKLSLPNGSESSARTRTSAEAFKLTEYPETAADVLAISQAINTPMSQAQAQAYIDNRIRADWHQGIGGTGRKIKMEAIPADIRLWVDRDKAEQNRNRATTTEREAKRNATAGSFGRYVPKN